MYDISNRSDAIREIQRYLLELYYYAGSKSPVIMNGIYDAATREAVRAYQKGRALPPTGVVDRQTFNALFADYRIARESRLLSDEISSDTSLPVSLGAKGEGVRALKALMNLLAERYRLSARSDGSDVFSYAASEVAKELQAIYRMPRTGTVDPTFYGKMLRDRKYPAMPPRR